MVHKCIDIGMGQQLVCSGLLDGSGLHPFAPSFVMVDKCISLSKVASGIVDHGGHGVRADVGGWASILDVALAVVMHCLGWDSERARSVSASVRELGKTGGLVDSRQSLVVVGSVQFDVEGVLILEEHHNVVNVLHLAGSSSHRLGREVCVASRSVPVREEFWLEGDGEAELFGASVEEESSEGHVVTLLDTGAWTDLELPLSWHHLSIGAGDLDSSVEAALVMGVVEGSTEGDVSTD